MENYSVWIHPQDPGNVSNLTGFQLNGSLGSGMYPEDSPAYTLDELKFYVWFYQRTVPALFGLTILLGVVGNALVIGVLASSKKNRTHVNVLLINLAVADIVFLVISVPFVTYRYVGENWDIGEPVCKASHYFIYVTVYVTMYSLIVISVVRYVFVVHSVQTVRFPVHHLWLIILAIWILALLGNVPIWRSYEVKEILAPGSLPYNYCAVSSYTAGKIIFTTFFLGAYVLPLVLICVFSLLLVRHLKVTRQNSSLKQTSSTRRRTQQQGSRSANVTRTLVVVIVVLALCWLPLHVHLIITYFMQQPKSRLYEIYRVLAHVLAYCNSCMNPLIYAFVSRDFRDRVKSLSLCQRFTRYEYFHRAGSTERTETAL